MIIRAVAVPAIRTLERVSVGNHALRQWAGACRTDQRSAYSAFTAYAPPWRPLVQWNRVRSGWTQLQ
jgi:hypothetical protein